MKVCDNWKQSWLKEKPYCYNPKHELYNPLIDKLLKDLNKGQNVIVITVGRPRSGKTYFSIWLMCFMNWCFFGRDEYEPKKDNLEPLKDIYWKLDDFVNATKKTENQNKFLVMEEQGVEQYAKDFWKEDVQSFDKLTQIFGIDNTNIIINLPYIFDIQKGTRLKAHYLYRTVKKSKKRVDIVLFEKKMSLSTEMAYFRNTGTVWEKIPNIENKFPKLVEEYEKMKKKYNETKKNEMSKGNKPKMEIFARL